MTTGAPMLRKIPLLWTLERAGRALVEIAPADVSVSVAPRAGAGSAIATVVAAPSYPQSGGRGLSIADYHSISMRCRGACVGKPSPGPQRAPALALDPPLAPLSALSARRTATPGAILESGCRRGAGSNLAIAQPARRGLSRCQTADFFQHLQIIRLSALPAASVRCAARWPTHPLCRRARLRQPNPRASKCH
jgi:hypothetical protein